MGCAAKYWYLLWMVTPKWECALKCEGERYEIVLEDDLYLMETKLKKKNEIDFHRTVTEYLIFVAAVGDSEDSMGCVMKRK